MIDACQVDEEINKQSEIMRAKSESEALKNLETEGIRKILKSHINIFISGECGRWLVNVVEDDEFIRCLVGGSELSLIIDSDSIFNLISPKD